MAIERAIMNGTILNAVVVKNMFTADVVEIGNDTSPILWEAYLHGIYDHFQDLVGSSVAFTSYELQRRIAGQWNTTGFFSFPFTGVGTGAQTPNQMALVLIGKALGVRRMGRKFFSGLDITGMAGNTLTTGGLLVAAEMVLNYISPFTGIGGGTITPGIMSSGDVFHPFVGGLVSAFLGTMRRRKPGVGI